MPMADEEEEEEEGSDEEDLEGRQEDETEESPKDEKSEPSSPSVDHSRQLRLYRALSTACRMCSAAANLLFALYVFSHLTSYFSEGGDGDAGSSLETRGPLAPEAFMRLAWVDDFYGGDIYDAFEEAARHKDSLFVFYAPWDADSMAARKVLDDVSFAFEDHTGLYVAAVNCWNRDGDCYRDFGSGSGKKGKGRLAANLQFPIFVFYPGDRRGIQYSGPITRMHLTQFVLNAQNPVEVYGSAEEFARSRAGAGGNALVGYFPGAVGGPNYRRFLNAAYDLLEPDPLRTAVGAVGIVVSDELAFSLHLNPSRPVRYFHWDGSSFAYPNKTVRSAEALVQWVADKTGSHLVSWSGTSGRKSLRFGQSLLSESGNSLLVFLPREHHPGSNEALYLLRELAVEYRSCNSANDSSTTSSTNKLLQDLRMKRLWNRVHFEEELRRCQSDPWFARDYCTRYCDSHPPGPGGCPSEACRPSRNNASNPANAASWSSGEYSFLKTDSGAADDSGYRLKKGGPLRDINVHNQIVSGRRLSCALVASVLEERDTHDCDNDATESDAGEDEVSVEGLACADNRTLNFLALDAGTQSALLERLTGRKSERSGHAIVAVIVESGRETVYLMEGRYGRRNLARFVSKFHADHGSLKQLKRSFRERPEEGVVKEVEEVILQELDLERFSSVAGNKSNHSSSSVILYQIASCGFCSGNAHVFHTVKRILEPLLVGPDSLRFYTVDAARNDLPWHFTALSVPSILFMSTGETRAFPTAKSLTVPNLLSFVVANLGEEARASVSASLCDDDCLVGARWELAKRTERAILTMDDDEEVSRLRQLDDRLSKEMARRGMTTQPAEDTEETRHPKAPEPEKAKIALDHTEL